MISATRVNKPHLVKGEGFEKDPEFRRSALIGFGARRPDQGWRMSWYTDAESSIRCPLRMHYGDLDPSAQYKVRVVYGGDMPRVPFVWLRTEVSRFTPTPRSPSPVAPLEFTIPRAATRGWNARSRMDASGGSRRERSRLSGFGSVADSRGRTALVEEVYARTAVA